jgi:competence protein ComEA
MDYFYKEFIMSNLIKNHVLSYVKRCAVIGLTFLLTLASTVSFAQSDKIITKNKSAVASVKSPIAMVYLNNSSIEQLVTLKGIGHKKAQAIVTYRERVGAFKSIAELTQVKGIGEKILDDNKTRLQI